MCVNQKKHQCMQLLNKIVHFKWIEFRAQDFSTELTETHSGIAFSKKDTCNAALPFEIEFATEAVYDASMQPLQAS